GELLAHVLDHLPPARHTFERLGHILAELPDHAAALGAGARCWMDDALARQMLRQRPAGGLALERRAPGGPCRRRHLRRCLVLGGGLLELSELELELGDDLRPTLRRLAVLLTACLGEQ